MYSFEKQGVLKDVNDEKSVIAKLRRSYYKELKETKKIFSGMIPKLDNAYKAIDAGVSEVIIGKGEELDLLITGKTGTTISHE